MRSFAVLLLVCLGAFFAPVACVDPLELTLRGTNDIIVVDGTITNLAELQIIRLNRSKADPFTGRPGTVPITKAVVDIIVDSSQVIAAHETQQGTYQLPNDFKGQVGHAYQLRFTLADGTRYESTQETMPIVPTISRVSAKFNPTSLPIAQLDGFTAAHDLFIDTQDPANEPNFYRWDWRLWEKQEWCRSCVQGAYSVNNVLINYSSNGIRYFEAGNAPFENCFYPTNDPSQKPYPYPYWVWDYACRTQCWEILPSYDLKVFADTYTDGGTIVRQKVAQIPFYQHSPCLVEIRQAALTPSAYRFYKNLQDQTQNTGGLADTPPTASAGNVQNTDNQREFVIGFFTASAVSTVRHWLDRKDTQGTPIGLFEALNGRPPSPEPPPPTQGVVYIVDNSSRSRPYTAVCVPSNSQTPFKPEGWRE